MEGLIAGFAGGAIGSFAGTAAALLSATYQGWTPILPPYLPLLTLSVCVLDGYRQLCFQH